MLPVKYKSIANLFDFGMEINYIKSYKYSNLTTYLYRIYVFNPFIYRYLHNIIFE